MPKPRRVRPALALIGILGMAGLVAANIDVPQAQKAAAPQPGQPPAVQWAGHDSRIGEGRCLRVRDEEAWETLWHEHIGRTREFGAMGRHRAPKIDFARYEVVAMFGGASANTDGFLAQGIVEGDGKVHLNFERSTFQTSSGLNAGPDTGVATTPYGIWVIDRSAVPVVIHEGRRGLKHEPARWHEVRTLDVK